MNHYCAKFYTKISTNMDTTNISIFSLDFCTEFLLFSPQKSNFGPIQLSIIAYIVSKAMNYNSSKFKLLSKS